MKELLSLTTPQQNIWNLHMFYENTAIANQCGAVFFDRFLDEQRLRRALKDSCSGEQRTAHPDSADTARSAIY